MYGRNLSDLQEMLDVYRNTSLGAELAVADPYIITKMLYQGVFERIAKAKGAIARGDLESKSKLLSSASAILEHLRSTLDYSFNRQLAENLSNIYLYMLEKLNDASINLRCEPLDLALKVFLPVKQAWDKIPVSAQQEANRIRAQSEYASEYFNQSSSLTQGRV